MKQLIWRRAMAALVLFLLAVLVIVVEAFITTIVFFISFYWIGFAVFFLAGAVPYSRRLDRVPYLALAGFAVTVALLYYLSARYPEADVFGFAFPTFILGLASRFGVASFRESN
ncbi:MAG TPA: hypothetical protein VF906_05540 [Candidatus Bathyarchaeia archaeon]